MIKEIYMYFLFYCIFIKAKHQHSIYCLCL